MPSTGSLMRQYCSVCKAHFDMSVVSESAEDGVVWLKCPNCKGILPHMPKSDGEGEEAGDAPPDPLADLDISVAKPYASDQSFEVGDVLHHRGWDDYGLVTEKTALPGNRNVIKVRFVESGEVQLIEGAVE